MQSDIGRWHHSQSVNSNVFRVSSLKIGEKLGKPFTIGFGIIPERVASQGVAKMLVNSRSKENFDKAVILPLSRFHAAIRSSL